MRRTAALLMILVGLVLMASRLRAPGQGYIGIAFPNPGDDPRARILEVRPSWPAEKAGMQRDDIIIMFDGRSVSRMELVDAIREAGEGAEVEFTVLRNGREVRLTATLALRPPENELQKLTDDHKPDDPGLGGGERQR